MTNDDIKPEGYPDWDTDWREATNECKREVHQVLADYRPSVAHYVLAQLLADGVYDRARKQFAREWRKERVE